MRFTDIVRSPPAGSRKFAKHERVLCVMMDLTAIHKSAATFNDFVTSVQRASDDATTELRALLVRWTAKKATAVTRDATAPDLANPADSAADPAKAASDPANAADPAVAPAPDVPHEAVVSALNEGYVTQAYHIALWYGPDGAVDSRPRNMLRHLLVAGRALTKMAAQHAPLRNKRLTARSTLARLMQLHANVQYTNFIHSVVLATVYAAKASAALSGDSDSEHEPPAKRRRLTRPRASPPAADGPVRDGTPLDEKMRIRIRFLVVEHIVEAWDAFHRVEYKEGTDAILAPFLHFDTAHGVFRVLRCDADGKALYVAPEQLDTLLESCPPPVHELPAALQQRVAQLAGTPDSAEQLRLHAELLLNDVTSHAVSDAVYNLCAMEFDRLRPNGSNTTEALKKQQRLRTTADAALREAVANALPQFRSPTRARADMNAAQVAPRFATTPLRAAVLPEEPRRLVAYPLGHGGAEGTDATTARAPTAQEAPALRGAHSDSASAASQPQGDDPGTGRPGASETPGFPDPQGLPASLQVQGSSPTSDQPHGMLLGSPGAQAQAPSGTVPVPDVPPNSAARLDVPSVTVHTAPPERVLFADIASKVPPGGAANVHAAGESDDGESVTYNAAAHLAETTPGSPDITETKAREVIAEVTRLTVVFLNVRADELELDITSERKELQLNNNVYMFSTDAPYNTRREAGRDNAAYDTFTEQDMDSTIALAQTALVHGGLFRVHCSFDQAAEWKKKLKECMDTSPPSFHSANNPRTPAFRVPPHPQHVIMQRGHYNTPAYPNAPQSHCMQYVFLVYRTRGTTALPSHVHDPQPGGFVPSTYGPKSDIIDNVPRLRAGELLMQRSNEAPDRWVPVRAEQKPLAQEREALARHAPKELGPVLVLDTFAGTGTTAVACLLHDPPLVFVGCEVDTYAYKRATERIQHVIARQLAAGSFRYAQHNVAHKALKAYLDGGCDVDVQAAARIYLATTAADNAIEKDHINWRPPRGLPGHTTLPTTVAAFLIDATNSHVPPAACAAVPFDKWNQKLISAVQTLSPFFVSAAVCAALGLGPRPAPQSGAAKGATPAPAPGEPEDAGDDGGAQLPYANRTAQGLFALRAVPPDEVICYLYGQIVYADLASRTQNTKSYGARGVYTTPPQFRSCAYPIDVVQACLTADSDTSRGPGSLTRAYIVPMPAHPVLRMRRGTYPHCNANIVYAATHPSTVELMSHTTYKVMSTRAIGVGEEIVLQSS